MTAMATSWGDFLKLSSVRRDGSFATLERVNHTLVHLLFLARLSTYREIATNRDADRNTLLQQIHLEYGTLLLSPLSQTASDLFIYFLYFFFFLLLFILDIRHLFGT